MTSILTCTLCGIDLINLEEFNIPFELGEPFKPYEQLMGVLPEASKQHIPQAYWVCGFRTFYPVWDRIS